MDQRLEILGMQTTSIRYGRQGDEGIVCYHVDLRQSQEWNKQQIDRLVELLNYARDRVEGRRNPTPTSSSKPEIAVVPEQTTPPTSPTANNQKLGISEDLLNLFKKTEERQKEIKANAPNVIATLTGSRKAIYDFVAKYPNCTKHDIILTPNVDRYTVADDMKFLEDNGVLVRDMTERAHKWRLA